MTRGARLYATAVIAAGSLVVAASVFGWPSSDGRFSVAYLLLVVLASMAKLKLPGIVGTYSLNAPLLVFGVVYLTLPETLAAGCAGALTQSLWRAKRRPSAVQVLFNAANLAISIGLCALANRYLLGREAGVSQPVALALAAGLYFLTNTYLTSEVLALVESKSLRDVWRQWYLWSAPYFLVGTAVVGVTPFGGRSPEPASWVILVALLYLVHFFYSLSVKPPGSAPASENTASGIPNRARMYIQAVVFAGLLMVAFGIAQGEWPQPVRFAAYLAVATLASLCKVRLPRMTGTISLNFVLLIVAVVELPFSEVVLISAVAGVAQSVWKTRKRPRPVQVVFNAACLVVSASLAWAVCRWLAVAGRAEPGLLLLAPVTLVLYVCNTAMVAGVLCLVEGRPLTGIWNRCNFWALPYYLVGTTASGLMIATGRIAGWQTSLLVLPAMALIYVSYRLHVGGAARQAVSV